MTTDITKSKMYEIYDLEHFFSSKSPPYILYAHGGDFLYKVWPIFQKLWHKMVIFGRFEILAFMMQRGIIEDYHRLKMGNIQSPHNTITAPDVHNIAPFYLNLDNVVRISRDHRCGPKFVW